jgi:hypothetical protein
MWINYVPEELQYSIWCVCQGELAWDPRSRGLRPVAGEMLKVRGQGQGWTCIFYDTKERVCQRYSQRPAECVAFACDAPELLMALLDEPPLTRAVLVQPGSALEAIVAEHESSFPVANAVAWARNPGTRSQAWELARQERHFRAALAQRLGVGDDVLWPYLGRPLRYIVDAVAGGSSFLGALPTDELGPHRG